MNPITEEDLKNVRVLKNSADSRRMIRAGFRLVDIRPKWENGIITKESVFVFQYEDEFDEYLKK
jgi:hypothetical protein